MNGWRRYVMPTALILTVGGLASLGRAGVREEVRVFELEPEYARKNCTRIQDPNALNGLAGLCAAEGGKATIWAMDRWGERPGRYRLTVRMRLVDEPKAKTKLLRLLAMQTIGAKAAATSVWFTSDQLPADGSYGDASVEFDRYDGPKVDLRLIDEADAVAFVVDRVTITLVKRFTDQELLAKAPAPPKPQGLTVGGKPGLDIHVVRGPLAQAQQLDKTQALLTKQAGARITTSVYEFMYRPYPLTGYPDTWEALYGKDVIVFFNADAHAITAAGRQMLAEFVADGGGLMVVGGRLALAEGDYTGTVLEPLLPIDAAKGKLRSLDRPSAIGADQQDPKAPRIMEYFEAQARTGAQVEAVVGSKPLTVTGRHGKGRVGVWTGSPYGTYPEGVTPFWKADYWPIGCAAYIAELCAEKGGAQ